MILSSGERAVWAAAFARVIGEPPYGGEVTYKVGLAEAHRKRRDRAVYAADDAVENLRAAARESIEEEDDGAVMLRAMLGEE